jgi:hypothetical protein
MDVREKPDGHVIVSKNEQDSLLKTYRSVQGPKTPGKMGVTKLEVDDMD